MKRILTQYGLLVLLTLTVVGLGDVNAQQAEGDTKPKPRNSWQPPQEDRSAYREIIDLNIFRSDRKQLANKAERDRNPTKPREPDKTEPVRVVEKAPANPANPDALLRLTGIGHTAQGVVAFIEHTESGELSSLTGPNAFSQGQVTDIGYRSVVYVVDGQRREINIGETFVGERAVLASDSPVGSDSSSKSGLSPAERLRLLREKRARELGAASPGQTPAPVEKLQAPDASERTAPTQPRRQAPARSTPSTPNETVPIPAGSNADANNP